MTVLYVDIEHDQVRRHPERGPSHRDKLEAARDRLAAAAGASSASLHVSDVSLDQVERDGLTAIVISGCTTDWADYDQAMLEGLLAVVRAAPVSILGLCGGHQLIGKAHGASWGPLGPLRAGETDPDPRFVPGLRKQRGFLPFDLDPRCPLFAGMGQIATMFQSHYWQLEDVPPGFVVRASSPWSAIQAIERVDRPVFGVQFHPERYDDAHPDGEAILRNFFALV